MAAPLPRAVIQHADLASSVESDCGSVKRSANQAPTIPRTAKSPLLANAGRKGHPQATNASMAPELSPAILHTRRQSRTTVPHQPYGALRALRQVALGPGCPRLACRPFVHPGPPGS